MLRTEDTNPVEPGSHASHQSCTLRPILDDGPDALAPDAADNIQTAKLSQLVTTSEEPAPEVTTKAADDLFRLVAIAPDAEKLITPGSHIIRATITIQFKGSTQPHIVDILPPDTVIFHDAADEPRIAPFLTKRQFLTPTKIATALAILISLAGAVLPDDDPDDDDPDDDEISQAQHGHSMIH